MQYMVKVNGRTNEMKQACFLVTKQARRIQRTVSLTHIKHILVEIILGLGSILGRFIYQNPMYVLMLAFLPTGFPHSSSLQILFSFFWKNCVRLVDFEADNVY